jgi:hypothetical protein
MALDISYDCTHIMYQTYSPGGMETMMYHIQSKADSQDTAPLAGSPTPRQVKHHELESFHW